MILTPQQELVRAVDVLASEGIPFNRGYTDRGEDRRACHSTNKKSYDVEILVLGRNPDPVLRIAHRNPATRTEMNDILLGKLRKQGFFKDIKLSSEQFPTFRSEDIVSDAKKFIETINSSEEFEDSLGNTWKFNGGLEAGTWHIVDTIRSAVNRGHTSALGRDMYECLRGHVEVNRYDADAGLTWGEHVVPIDYMTQFLCGLAKEGASEDAMYDFLMRNHKVAYITPAQASIMDKELKLQTTMTEGWKDGDSPFARLEAADIIVEGAR